MEINAALNLVFPIRSREVPDKDDPEKSVLEPIVWAYHTPIGREVFEANYRVIASTQIALSGKGKIGFRIATLALKDAARADAIEYGLDADTSGALLAEIKRLTAVLAPSPAGYATVPVDRAIAQGIIDAEDWSEVESALVFFTAAWSICTRSVREGVAKALGLVLMGSTTSLKPTEFAGSLAISTPAATSAEPEPETSGTAIPQ